MEEIKLSKENYNSLNENYLYKKKPIIDNSFWVGTTSGTYHCKNWTFTVSKDEGRAFMSDTYFDKIYEQVTNKNIKRYKKVFDLKEVTRIRDDEVDEYKKEDLYCVATDSSGYSFGNLYWVKKSAQKSKKLLIKKKKKEIESLERKLKRAKNSIEELKNATKH